MEILHAYSMHLTNNYFDVKDRPSLFLFLNVPHEGVWFGWEFMIFECDVTKNIELNQMELVTSSVKIQSVDLYRDTEGILKIKILDHKPS